MSALKKEDSDTYNAIMEMPDPLTDTEAEAIEVVDSNPTLDEFWTSITEADQNLLRMKMDGLTQKEIAAELGYKTHSAVTKRLQKLKEIFNNCA